MPIVRILLVEGRKTEAIKRCLKAVAQAVHDTLGAPMSTIRIVVQQVPAAHWAIGEDTRNDIDAAMLANVPAAKPAVPR